MRKSQKIAWVGVFSSVAIAISVLESYFSFSSLLPGLKLGLANIVSLTALYILGPIYALAIQFVRIMLTGFLRASPITFLFSFVGGMTSILLVILIRRINKEAFSVVGLSVIGAIVHNVAQFFAALLVLKNIDIFWYIAFLTLFAVLGGVLTGISAKYLIKALEANKRH